MGTTDYRLFDGGITEVGGIPVLGNVGFAMAVRGSSVARDTVNVTRALTSGGLNGTSLLADSLAVARALLDGGGFVGTSTTVDTMRVARALLDSGGLKGTSALANAPLAVKRALAEALVAQVTVAAAIKATRPLAGAVGGLTVVSDTMRVARALLDGGGFAGAGTLANEPLKVARAFVEHAAGAATVGAIAMPVARKLTAAVSGAATITEALNVRRVLVTAVGGQATITASAKVARHFAGSVVGIAALADAVTVARHLSLAAAGQATVAADLTVVAGGGPVSLAVSVAGGVSLAFELSRERPLVASVAALAVLADALQNNRSFTFPVEGAGGLGAHGSVARRMAVAVLAHGLAVGQLGIGRIFGLQVDAGATIDLSIISAVAIIDAVSVTRLAPYVVTLIEPDLPAASATQATAVAASSTAPAVQVSSATVDAEPAPTPGPTSATYPVAFPRSVTQ